MVYHQPSAETTAAQEEYEHPPCSSGNKSPKSPPSELSVNQTHFQQLQSKSALQEVLRHPRNLYTPEQAFPPLVTGTETHCTLESRANNHL